MADASTAECFDLVLDTAGWREPVCVGFRVDSGMDVAVDDVVSGRVHGGGILSKEYLQIRRKIWLHTKKVQYVRFSACRTASGHSLSIRDCRGRVTLSALHGAMVSKCRISTVRRIWKCGERPPIFMALKPGKDKKRRE